MATAAWVLGLIDRLTLPHPCVLLARQFSSYCGFQLEAVGSNERLQLKLSDFKDRWLLSSSWLLQLVPSRERH